MHLLDNGCRYLVIECFRNSTRDTSNSITIPAQGHCQTDSRLEIMAIKERRQGCRQCTLTRHIEITYRANIITITAEVIAESLLYILVHFCFGTPSACQIDGCCHCLRPFDTFEVVVGNHGRTPTKVKGVFHRLRQPAARRSTHCRAIAPRIVRMTNSIRDTINRICGLVTKRDQELLHKKPTRKCTTITGIRILVSPLDKAFFQSLLRPNRVVKQTIRHGDGHHRIICEGTAVRE